LRRGQALEIKHQGKHRAEWPKEFNPANKKGNSPMSLMAGTPLRGKKGKTGARIVRRERGMFDWIGKKEKAFGATCDEAREGGILKIACQKKRGRYQEPRRKISRTEFSTQSSVGRIFSNALKGQRRKCEERKGQTPDKRGSGVETYRL